MGLPVSGYPNQIAVSMEDDLGDRYVSVKDFLKVGVLASVVATLIVGTIGVVIIVGLVLDENWLHCKTGRGGTRERQIGGKELFEVFGSDMFVARVDDGLTRSPDHDDIVLGRRGKGPFEMGAPAEIGWSAGMPTVHEYQFGRTVFCILGRLFLTDLAERVVALGVLVDIPVAHCSVFTSRQDVALLQRRPAQAIPFRRLALEHNIGPTNSIGRGRVGVLGAVKDVRLSRDGARGDQVAVLRTVSRAVDLAVVVDLLDDGEARRGGRVAADLALVLVVLLEVEPRLGGVRRSVGARGGQLHLRDLQVVLVLLGRVRAQQQPVLRVRLPHRRLLVREPLARERRPLERMRHHEIIQEGRVLLPDLVLFVRQLLLRDGRLIVDEIRRVHGGQKMETQT
ncbi:hypothetical protein L1887_62085 [Cichorium endivia]|nr:hypothetical protein L1887_62085 [Cichorium endivia]